MRKRLKEGNNSQNLVIYSRFGDPDMNGTTKFPIINGIRVKQLITND